MTSPGPTMATFLYRSIPVFAMCLSLAIASTTVAADSAVENPNDTQVRLAQELVDALTSALEAASKARPQVTALQQRTRDASLGQWKRALSMAEQYRDRVEDQTSLDENQPLFETLRSSVIQARETASDAIPDPDVTEHLKRIQTTLNQLAQLYRAQE